MLISDRIRISRNIGRILDALQRGCSRLSKFKSEPAGPEVATKLLAKQHFDIGFVIDN
jgi:hypothetical protein